MKSINHLTGLRFAFALLFLHQLAAANPDVNLGTATNFSVLAASAISSTGVAPAVINGGNVGIYPNGASSITGPIVIAPSYTTYAADSAGVARTAQNDLSAAYYQAAGLGMTANLSGEVLGAVGTLLNPLTPGVYFFSSSAQLTGTLYLNDEGEKDPAFVFQIGSTLTTAADSSIVELEQGSGTMAGANIVWQVGTSATLGAGTDFDGNILAYTSITDDGGSTVNGRLLAMGGGGAGGAINLDDTIIDTPSLETAASGAGAGVPDGGNTLLLLAGLTALLAVARRFSPSSSLSDLGRRFFQKM